MIYNGDCRDFLSTCGPYKMIFLDPPDNIGLSYGTYSDKLPPNVYYGWLETILHMAFKKASIIWLSYYYKHDLAISGMVDRMLRDWYGSWSWRKILWRFTFGQYRDNDFTNGYRPILCLTAHGVTLDYSRIRVVSKRMLLGDPRASGLRVPDDVWEIPRVTGNSKERRQWHPTQHPEELMDRILLLSGGPVLDCFGGTGTTLRCATRLGIPCDLCEIDPHYVQEIQRECSVQ